MKKGIIFVAVVVIAGLAWWLGSPLFLNKVVDDDFPATQQTAAEKRAELKEEKIVEGMDVTEASYETMTENEKKEVEIEVVEKFSKMPVEVVEETMPEPREKAGEVAVEPIKLVSGDFQGADEVHKGSGTATVYELEDGSKVLRLENFSVTNGPDLRVYLTDTANPTKGRVKTGAELAKLKGNKGNQNYKIPSYIGTDDFKAVVIYCKPFGVIFATANLSE